MLSKAKQIKNIKRWIEKRVASKMLNHTYDSALAYYQRFSPDMFIRLSKKDVDQLIKELKEKYDV